MISLSVLLLLCCTALAPLCVVRASDSPAALLQQCYNADDPAGVWKPGTFAEFLQGQTARLRLHKVYWSEKPPPSPQPPGSDSSAKQSTSLTIFTAATVSRLDFLASQCRQWSGTLAAAVYVPLEQDAGVGTELSADSKQTLDTAVMVAGQLFQRMEAEATSCALRLLLTYELVSEDMLGRLLPVNSLRNTALLAADSELVAMVDVDLLPSKTLSHMLTTRQAELQQIKSLCEQRTLVIMPAFETAQGVNMVKAQNLAEELVQGGNKSHAVSAVHQGLLVPFASVAYPRGHNATDFTRWYTATEPYTVEYQINYEPWFIGLRRDTLLYDARFRGYGWNKVAQVAHHNLTGFTFTIHPSLFLVHRPHPRSDALGLYRKASTGTSASKTQEDTRRRRLLAATHTMDSSTHTLPTQSGTHLHSLDRRLLATSTDRDIQTEEVTQIQAQAEVVSGSQRRTLLAGPVTSKPQASVHSEAVSQAKLFHRRVATLRHVAIRAMRRGEYSMYAGRGVASCLRTLPWWQGVFDVSTLLAAPSVSTHGQSSQDTDTLTSGIDDKDAY